MLVLPWAKLLVKAEQMEWRPKSLPGLHEKMLWRDEETGASMALIRFEKGVRYSGPAFPCVQSVHVLSVG